MTNTHKTLPCYGKINLFLEVHDRRADGFHNLGSLFQTIGCADQLQAEPWDRIELSCPAGITVNPEDNLVMKAARLVQKAYAERIKNHSGIRFALEKNLPSAAGLGGGSSNAAAALLLCNQIWELELSPKELAPLAAQLGADVPFFLYGGAFFGEGKGEILQPAPEPFPFHIVIGTPESRVETGWAYKQLNPVRKQDWGRFKALYMTYSEDWQFYQTLKNDFDPPIRGQFPPIQTLFDLMQSFSPVKTLLCGSGASLFSLFREKKSAQECLANIQSSCRFSCLTEFVT